MRPVMTVMGSLILAGNLLLAVPVRQSTVVVRNAEQSEQEVRKGVAQALVDKGIESASAAQMVTEQYGHYERNLAVGYAHMRILFPELEREAILSDMAERALRQEAFAFDDYDQVVSMLYRLKGISLSPSHYERARQCVLLNRNLFRS
jgi:hypothetical protein